MKIKKQHIAPANVLSWAGRLPLLSIIMLTPLILFGIFGPMIYPHDPHSPDLSIALQPPAWVHGGSLSYFLGTDQLGRDLLSRIMEGARPSLLVAVFGVIFSGILGVSLGLIAGFSGGKIDNIIMRIVDAWMTIPGLFFMLMFVVIMRQTGLQGLVPIIISIAITMWVPYARMVRSEALSIKEREFVLLARVTGCSDSRITFRHIFPNVINTIVVMATTQLGGAIMAEAGMSFLGVGIQPPKAAWGVLISESSVYLSTAWWIPMFAGLAITFTVLGSNLFGDWLRDILDPLTRQSLQ